MPITILQGPKFIGTGGLDTVKTRGCELGYIGLDISRKFQKGRHLSKHVRLRINSFGRTKVSTRIIL